MPRSKSDKTKHPDAAMKKASREITQLNAQIMALKTRLKLSEQDNGELNRTVALLIDRLDSILSNMNGQAPHL